MSDCRKIAILAALCVVFGCITLVSANSGYCNVCCDQSNSLREKFRPEAKDRRPTKFTAHCCKSVSKVEIPYEIIGYKRHQAMGPCVNAIIFQTKKNGRVCTHPKARWVPKKLKELKKKP